MKVTMTKGDQMKMSIAKQEEFLKQIAECGRVIGKEIDHIKALAVYGLPKDERDSLLKRMECPAIKCMWR